MFKLQKSLFFRALPFVFAATIYPLSSTAALVVQVSKAVSPVYPVAVPSFGIGPADQPTVSQVIRYDLAHSGYTRVIPPSAYPNDPHHAHDLDLAAWQKSGAESLVFGNVLKSANGYTITAYQVNLLDPKRLVGQRYMVNRASYQRVGNQIANIVYRDVTHHAGPFSGHLLFVGQYGKNYYLYVSDCEGLDRRSIVRGHIPIISPAWSPNGHHVAYVTYRHQHSVIYIQNLSTGHRWQLPGNGYALSAPAYSPSGRYLAFARSRDGRTQVVTENLQTHVVRVLASQGTVNTSPVWSPSGRYIYFVSNRDGSAQIYRVSRYGGAATRITWSGGYNVSPAISPNGKWLVFVHSNRGVLATAIMHPNGTDLRVLYDGGNCERPSFSPDSRMVLFNTTRGGNKVLGQVAINGRGLHFLPRHGQDREGSWDFV